MKTKNLPAFAPVTPRLLAVLRLIAPMGNKSSIRVDLREDGTLNYSLHSSWTNNGGCESWSNLQMSASLPIASRDYPSTESLANMLGKLISSYSVRSFDSAEIINQIF